MIARVIACAALLSSTTLSSMALGQVIYEPVIVQHGGQNPYYYAGNDPAIHASARFPFVEGATWGRVHGYAFVSPRRAVVQRRARVFTDAIGGVDVRPYGFTPAQAVNEANARLPRYFRKGDLLAAGVSQDNDLIVVPANAPANLTQQPRGTIIIRPSTPGLHGGRSPVLVLPRGMLDRKVGDITGANRPQRPA